MKYEILKELKANTHGYVSGENISEKLCISRTAVWKYINQLKAQGYKIESRTRQGYRLVESPDRLDEAEIQPLLKTGFVGRQIIYMDTVDSTNTYAKKMAESHFKEGTVIISDEQTGGRGRLGRIWISPKGKGIWMTILLKPQIDPKDASKVTLLTATAVCRGIEKASGLQTQIKWPNDIVAGGKKLCGILIEMGAEIDAIGYLIVGIGINANLDSADYTEEVARMATSIKIETGSTVQKKHIVAEVLNEFEGLYKEFIQSGSIASFMKEYKQKSAVLGREVRVIYRKEEITGVIKDISPEGHLIIVQGDGTEQEILSGEVSVRGLYGYI